MSKLLLRVCAAALLLAAAIAGCGGGEDSPVAPKAEFDGAKLFDLPSCGEESYLSAMIPLLPAWADSIEAWLPGTVLDETPDWNSVSVSDHLAALVPALQQWQGEINAAAGSELLAALEDFDPQATTTQNYLSALSSLLLDWETAMETARGLDFLVTLPAFEPDQFAPLIECPLDTTIVCADAEGAVLEFEVLAMDDCDAEPVVVCDPPSRSLFPVGTTTVNCTATDASGNVGSCSFDVTVEAATVTLNSITASPMILWPPNHKMVDISFIVDAENECELDLECTVLEVSSNEEINGLGDGNTEPDWMIAEDGSLKLRAERAGGGTGRKYQVLVRCEDASGVGDEMMVEVVVPHDSGEDDGED